MSSYQGHFSVLVFLLISAFPTSSPSLDLPFPTQEQSGKVEIVIRNSTYEFQEGILRPNEASTIILRNLDKIQHGFTSSLMEELDFQVETDGATTYGKGIKGVHINPGGTVRLHFIPPRPGIFSFQCDLHPSMKGEVLLLSVEQYER